MRKKSLRKVESLGGNFGLSPSFLVTPPKKFQYLTEILADKKYRLKIASLIINLGNSFLS
jgi:hypothetical protein